MKATKMLLALWSGLYISGTFSRLLILRGGNVGLPQILMEESASCFLLTQATDTGGRHGKTAESDVSCFAKYFLIHQVGSLQSVSVKL